MRAKSVWFRPVTRRRSWRIAAPKLRVPVGQLLADFVEHRAAILFRLFYSSFQRRKVVSRRPGGIGGALQVCSGRSGSGRPMA